MWADDPFTRLPCLIAEDSSDDLLMLQQALRAARIPNPCVVTSTDQQTMEWLAQRSAPGTNEDFPVVLFLDLLMPQVSGLQVLRWLRDNPHLPLAIVLHTGVENDDMLQRARDLGASFHLPKGSRPDAIREVFRRARAEWEQGQLVGA